MLFWMLISVPFPDDGFGLYVSSLTFPADLVFETMRTASVAPIPIKPFESKTFTLRMCDPAGAFMTTEVLQSDVNTSRVFVITSPLESSNVIESFIIISLQIPLSQEKSSCSVPVPDIWSRTTTALLSPWDISTDPVPDAISLFSTLSAFALISQFPYARFWMLRVFSELRNGPNVAPSGPFPKTEYFEISISVWLGIMVLEPSFCSIRISSLV